MSFDPRKIVRRLRYWLRRDQEELALREEIEEHRRRRGASSVAAPALRMEDSRAVWIPGGLTSFAQDLRYGTRQLRHSRLFTIVSLSGLTLAIGLSTALFSLMEAVFWRPLPVKDGDRVVRLLRIGRDDRAGGAFSEAELRHFRDAGALEGVTGFAVDDRVVAEWPQTEAPKALAALIAPEFLPLLGGQALAGRLLESDDAETLVLLTESAWKRRLDGKAGVAGSRLRLNGFPFTIAGVISDRSVAILGRAADVILPLRAAKLLGLPDAADKLELIGKLPPGMTFDQAQLALGAVSQRWFAAHPEDAKAYRALAIPARLTTRRPSGRVSGEDLLLPAAVLLVLLIACANLTNLLLARAEARRREMAVRLSLGASRARLIRQLLTECFLLTAAAGMLGLVCSYAILRGVQLMIPSYLPREAAFPWLDVSVNGTIFGFTLALCAITSVLFGLAPAWEATRGGAIRPGSFQPGARLRELLIAGQMAACTVLLGVTASLYSGMTMIDDFITSLDSGPVVQAELHLAGYGYTPAAAADFLRRARQRVAVLPEVAETGLTRTPFLRSIGHLSKTELEIEGRGQRVPAPGLHGTASEGVLAVFGQRLIGGRDFTSAEASAGAPVALINEPMARDLWPRAQSPGQRVRLWKGGQPGPWLEIAGVVAEQPLGPGGASAHSLLEPLGQTTSGYLQIRTRGDRAAAMLAVRRLIGEMDPRVSFNVNSLEALASFMRIGPRLVGAGALTVALAALLLSAIGLYGVTAYVASRRTKEIGIRMALGARPGRVVAMILRRGGVVVAGGVVSGLALGVAAERVVAATLRILPPNPAQIYLAIAAFLGLVALLAMAVPSLGAARVNPVAALRNDG